MGEGERLVRSGKQNFMLADYVAAAHGVDADFFLLRRPVSGVRPYTYAGASGIASEIDCASISAVPLGASSFRLWCFSIISISKSSQDLGALFHNRKQQIDTERHVRACKYRQRLGRLLDARALLRAVSRHGQHSRRVCAQGVSRIPSSASVLEKSMITSAFS